AHKQLVEFCHRLNWVWPLGLERRELLRKILLEDDDNPCRNDLGIGLLVGAHAPAKYFRVKRRSVFPYLHRVKPGIIFNVFEAAHRVRIALVVEKEEPVQHQLSLCLLGIDEEVEYATLDGALPAQRVAAYKAV